MHPYTIDTGVRKKVIIYIFIFSIVLSSVLTYFLEAGILSTKAWLQQFVWIDQVLKICDTVGVTTNFIGVPFLYGVIYWIFDKYLWKQKIFKRFLNVPDLNGYWEGKLTSLTYHLKVDYKDGNKWELMEPDYMELKVIFEKWQMGMQRGNAWNALFWCNHDQPRIVSRFGNEGEYWKESAKMLAGMIHLMRGTPYIYQGEEIGMTNPHYTSIEQYADVESRNYYEILLNEGKTKEEALEILAARSRDNSRTPMQWTDERYCGFSDTKPWIPVSDNFEKINVKKQKQDRDSILEFYKKLIMLRKEKEVIARGNIEFMEVENAGVLAYTRCLDKQKLLVCCNFRDVESQMEFTQEWKSGRKILGNYEENHKNNYKVLTLRPYEIIVLEKGEE